MQFKKYTEEETAQKPIQCFKVVIPAAQAVYPWYDEYEAKHHPTFYTLHERYRLIAGAWYHEPRWRQGEAEMEGEQIFGFRSYDSSVPAHKLKFDSLDTVVIKCEIPKGSLYFHDKDQGIYLSNQIKCIGYYPIYMSLWDSITYPFTRLLSLF